MTTTHDEMSQASEAGELNHLSPQDRQETQEILDDIAKGEGAKKDIDPETPDRKPEDGPDGKKEPPEKKPEEKKPDEGKKGEGDEGKKRRDATLIPSWQMKIAEERWSKENSELKARIEELSGKKVDGNLSKDDQQKEIEKIAEEEGLTVSAIERILEVAEKRLSPQQKLPQDLMEKLNQLDTLRAEREVEVETVKFSRDFDAIVLPLIKAEYGDDVPQNIIDAVREDLKELAYSPEFAKVPYTVLFKGDERFRGRVGEAKKGPESSAPGTHSKADAARVGDVDLTKPMSDDELKKLDPAQFDTYMSNMATLEKESNKPH